jgi:hypothetical protein
MAEAALFPIVPDEGPGVSAPAMLTAEKSPPKSARNKINLTTRLLNHLVFLDLLWDANKPDQRTLEANNTFRLTFFKLFLSFNLELAVVA